MLKQYRLNLEIDEVYNFVPKNIHITDNKMTN